MAQRMGLPVFYRDNDVVRRGGGQCEEIDRARTSMLGVEIIINISSVSVVILPARNGMCGMAWRAWLGDRRGDESTKIRASSLSRPIDSSGRMSY